jgi:hypothetical protein
MASLPALPTIVSDIKRGNIPQWLFGSAASAPGKPNRRFNICFLQIPQANLPAYYGARL